MNAKQLEILGLYRYFWEHDKNGAALFWALRQCLSDEDTRWVFDALLQAASDYENNRVTHLEEAIPLRRWVPAGRRAKKVRSRASDYEALMRVWMEVMLLHQREPKRYPLVKEGIVFDEAAEVLGITSLATYKAYLRFKRLMAQPVDRDGRPLPFSPGPTLAGELLLSLP